LKDDGGVREWGVERERERERELRKEREGQKKKRRFFLHLAAFNSGLFNSGFFSVIVFFSVWRCLLIDEFDKVRKRREEKEKEKWKKSRASERERKRDKNKSALTVASLFVNSKQRPLSCH